MRFGKSFHFLFDTGDTGSKVRKVLAGPEKVKGCRGSSTG